MDYKRKVRLKHTLPAESDDERYLGEIADIDHSLEELERAKFSETEREEIREKLEAKRLEIEERYCGDRSIRDLIMELIEEQYFCDLKIERIYEVTKELVERVNELLRKQNEAETRELHKNI